MRSNLQFRPVAVLLAVILMLQAGFARNPLARKPQSVVLSGRFIARSHVTAPSSYGANYDSYVFELDRPESNSPAIVKLAYRYLAQDAGIPVSLFDYRQIHKFRMTRDESCDESWDALSMRWTFDESGGFQGKESSLQYARNASPPRLEAQTTLPCYIVTPGDYRSTSRE